MIARLLLLTVLMSGTALGAGRATRTEAVPVREPLRSFPLIVGEWRGADLPDMRPEVVAQLGADEYLNRTYHSGPSAAGLYVGFYETQRQGDTIHSPMNCLPGTGWMPVDAGYLTTTVEHTPQGESGPITVRRYLVRRGADTALVLYWYQSRGRVVANDYWSKAYMVYDAIRLNRTDAALVRVVSAVSTEPGGERRAEADAVAFVQAMFPLLRTHLPE